MSAADRVAVTSRSFSRHATLRGELLARYPHTTFNDAGVSLSGDALVTFARGHSKLIVALEVLDDAFFAALPDLRVVSKYGVGVDTIDLHAMDRHGVRLGWTGGVNRRSVAELTVAFGISLLHCVPEASREIGKGRWRQVVGRQLTGRTVGVLGCGHVGKDVVRLLVPFACRVLAHDILDFPDFYAEHRVTPVDLETLLAQSDVVTIHLPLDASTRNMLDAKRLAMLKPSAVLINTARGGIVDERAVREMLRDRRLAGAAFDVLEHEPAVDEALAAMDNVIVTPHIGGSSEEAILAMGRAAIDGLDTAVLPNQMPGLRGLDHE